MKLVALVRAAARPDEAASALAGATGLALAEARMRLAPEPPALLAHLPAGEADRLVDRLRQAGLAVLALAPPVPTDRDRAVARAFTIDGAGLTVRPRSGDPVSMAWPDVLAILRGLRAARSQIERTATTRRFSVGMALATGGLAMTRTSRTTVRSGEESTEQVLLVYPRDGSAALLAEHQLDFACLGPGMQPSSTANMAELTRRLRERAPGAYHDERLLRLGRRPLPFLGGGESRIRTADVASVQTDTRGTLDVLAEVMRQGLAAGLLP